jgi:hypothetical protein
VTSFKINLAAPAGKENTFFKIFITAEGGNFRREERTLFIIFFKKRVFIQKREKWENIKRGEFQIYIGEKKVVVQ